MSEENNMIRHAKYELNLLEAASEKDEDSFALEMQKEITKDVLAVLHLISEQGHSGGSVGYFLNLVKKCVLQQNLTPLTGADNEWFDHGDFSQNIRYGAVFKNNSDNRAYYLDGYVTVDPNGSCCTGGDTPLCYIEFPYTPSTKYLPRLSLIPDLFAEERQERYEEFLFDSEQEVLEFYALNGIVQPPEEEHVVKLSGTASLVVTALPQAADPECDPRPPVDE